jgi:hypothetical protein
MKSQLSLIVIDIYFRLLTMETWLVLNQPRDGHDKLGKIFNLIFLKILEFNNTE